MRILRAALAGLLFLASAVGASAVTLNAGDVIRGDFVLPAELVHPRILRIHADGLFDEGQALDVTFAYRTTSTGSWQTSDTRTTNTAGAGGAAALDASAVLGTGVQSLAVYLTLNTGSVDLERLMVVAYNTLARMDRTYSSTDFTVISRADPPLQQTRVAEPEVGAQVPLPAGAWLMLTGLAAMGAARRRRRT